MIIRHVINSLGPGGAERLVVTLASEMAKRGHDVKIIILYDEKGPAYELAKKLNIEVIQLGKKRFDIKYIILLRKYLAEADVIHAHLFPSIYYISFLRYTGIKIMTEHNTHNRRREKPLWRNIEKWMYSQYDKIVCISNGTYKALSKWQPTLEKNEKLIKIYNGIQANFVSGSEGIRNLRKELGIRKNSKLVICVASLTEQKNHKTLFHAIKNLPDIELILAGDGALKDELILLVNQLNIKHRVHFLGVRNDIVNLLKQSDLFILPSLWEGFGLVVIEAMATGVPVIASNVDGVNELIEHGENGMLFNPQNPEELESIISDLLIHPKQMQKFVEQGLITSKRFHISSTVDSLLNLYRGISNGVR